VRFDLGGHAGGLLPATPGSVTVTIVDNDAAPPPPTAKLLGGKRATIRRHAFSVQVSTSDGGKLRATVKDRAGHVLARALTRRVGKGAVALKLKLTRRGRAALRRHRRVKVTLRVTYTAKATSTAVVLTRKLTLRR
jgi:hypothetical protein